MLAIDSNIMIGMCLADGSSRVKQNKQIIDALWLIYEII